MGELYRKANGSEKGLGDIILQAYDRTQAFMSERIAKLKPADPNAAASKSWILRCPAWTASRSRSPR